MTELFKSIYLGDRWCKRVILDGARDECGIQVNRISRLRPGTEVWDYYVDEDIEDCWMIFSGVQSVTIKPEGIVPNDFIELSSVVEREDNSFFVEFAIGSVNLGGNAEGTIQIVAHQLYLKGPEDFIAQLSPT